MVNLFKQLKTSKVYWSIHDALLKYWWAVAFLLICFWGMVIFIKGPNDTKQLDKSFFDNLIASDNSNNNVIDWSLWSPDKPFVEKSLPAEPNSIKVEEQNKEKAEIEEGLENLNKKYPNRKYVYWKSVNCKITFYTPDSRSCGNFSDGFTSKMDNAYRFDGVAACPEVIPYRSGILIPGIGIKEVDDTGGAMRQAAKKGFYHIDVRIKSHEEAEKFGVKWQKIHLFKIVG